MKVPRIHPTMKDLSRSNPLPALSAWRRGVPRYPATRSALAALLMGTAALAGGHIGRASAVPRLSKEKKPEARPQLIPLEPLGFQSTSTHFVSPLATSYTLHFVDEKHLLLTYTARSLLARLPDADENDDDRNVAAVLIELPSGKVVARTEWRTRDRDRYLWPLGHGRFLVRVRSQLSLLEPMQSLAEGGPGEALRRETFLELKRRIGYLAVSPDGELLGVETLPPPKPKLKDADADASALAAAMAGTSDAPKPVPDVRIVGQPHLPPVQIYFFRLKPEHADGSGHVVVQSAGRVGSPALINLPATAEGYLDTQKDKGGGWLFDFVSHSGKRLELSGYDTTCPPRPYFVSRSEFVAIGCRGSSDKAELSYFNLKGEQPWLAEIGTSLISPMLVAAPAAGRFALGWTRTNPNAFETESLTADDLVGQEITVRQNYDGRTLLKAQASPIQRMGQNFDLSPSGMQFAVVHEKNIEVYALPPLNEQDRKALQAARSMEPEPTDAPVRLNSSPVDVPAEMQAVEAPVTPHPAVSPKVAAQAASTSRDSRQTPAARGGVTALPPAEAVPVTPGPAAAAGEAALGDEVAPRKPPSLYSNDHPRTDADPGEPAAIDSPKL